MSVSDPSVFRPPGVAEDDTDFDHVYRRHNGWLLAFLRRRFGAQDAEDLAQETFVQLVRSRADIRNPRAFLARLALDAAGMQARRRLARPVLVSQDFLPAGLAGPADQEQALLLKQAILALPPKLREVFLLSRFAGLTYEEIARRCGVSVKTVEARMSKALAMCTALLA
ncbi:sigma-70 family RNA polymerase sigma factor [Phenylobacterium sp.]|jgi:RNA polymerase sigma-70 factor (ECF subfamily)|uniref:RNA polymerase sigma factor n=1 Tax=Phenylobacterium sp. TaxID=1871053 RepID=UPI002F4096E7